MDFLFGVQGPKITKSSDFPIRAPSTTSELKPLKLFMSNETKDTLFSLGLREAQR